MNVERLKSDKMKFMNVNYGDVFELGGDVYMKMDDAVSSNNAVNLMNGKCRVVEDEVAVTELRADLKVR